MKTWVVSSADDRIGVGTIMVINSPEPEETEDGWLFMSDKGEILAHDWVELSDLSTRNWFLNK